MYQVENTMDGDKKGLPSNYVGHLLAEPGIVWIYGDSFTDAKGLTRFAYRQTEHARRWATWTVENTTKNREKRDGLLSDSITGVVRAKDGGYWVFLDGSDGAVYQHFDPETLSVRTFPLLPPAYMGPAPDSLKFEAVNNHGTKVKLWHGIGKYKFIAWSE